MKRAWGRVPADVRLLLAILALLVPLRAIHTASVRWMLVDGGLYAEVARHVRDGEGLVTNLSLYHAGYDHFPHPTPIYPLWPLLLGYGSRIVDLATLAHWLPTALYFTSLVAAYLFGRRLWPEPMFAGVLPAFHAGHLLVLLLALQRHYIYFTSLPYTEGLSWTLLLLFLWRAFGNSASTRLAWGVELGLWAGGLYYCRSQFLLVPIAVSLALGLRVLIGPDRPRAALHAAVAGGVGGLLIGGWWLHLRSFLHDAGLQTLLRFDQNRATDVLEPLDIIVNRPGLGVVVLDRLKGVVLAWDPIGHSSYNEGFLATHWALPVALPFLAVAAVAFLRERGVRGVLERARGPVGFAWGVLLLLACGSLLSIHLAHKQFNGEWYFTQRQSLVCLLAFFLALGWMLRRQRPLPTMLGVLVLSTTTTLGVREVYRETQVVGGAVRGSDKQAEMVRWLNRASAPDPLVIAMAGSDTNRVGWRTLNVGYHQVYNTTSYVDLLKMMDVLGARYFFYEEKATRNWRFRREGAGRFEQDFSTLPDKPNGQTIVTRRTDLVPALDPQRVVVVGVDGASWKVMAPMLVRGELPTFAKLLREGASLTSFDTLDKTASPVVWTSVATGRGPEDHGVTDYTQELPGIGKVPVTSDARRVPALWNVASAGGVKVDVINWWATWPSEKVSGAIVSDHANPASAGWMQGEYFQADAAALAALAADTWPADLAPSLAKFWLDPLVYPWEDFQLRARLTDAQLAAAKDAPFNKRTTYSWLKTFYAVDKPHLDIALDRMHAGETDLMMLYLRGPDPIQHYAWDTVEPERYGRPPAELARDRGVVQGVYRYVDTFLAEVVAACGPDTTLIVLSDHGAEPAADARDPDRTERPGAHTRNAKGVLFLYGPSVTAGVKLSPAGPLDIAPTVAWLLGLPVADDLPGRLITEAFDEDFRLRRGRTTVDTWGKREASGGLKASPADDNMLEQLRGLGYIE